MLRGQVNPKRQPIVSITIRGDSGHLHNWDALLDSGFNGTIALPVELVASLGLPFWFSRTIMLADGSTQDVGNYRGRIVWEGIDRPIRILATGDQPLVGMALMNGYRITIDAVDGGAVSVQPVP